MQTLRDLIDSGDFSALDRRPDSMENYYDTLSDMLYGGEYDMTWEHYGAVLKTGRITRAPLREWLCTDTMVGVYLYLLDDVPVAVMHQTGRKSYPDWEFFSKEAFQNVKTLFDDCAPLRQDFTDDVPIVSAMLGLRLDPERFRCDVSHTDLGISPIVNFLQWAGRTRAALQDESPEVDLGVFEEYISGLIEQHDEFIKTVLPSERAGNIQEISQAYDDAKQCLADLKQKIAEMKDKQENSK